MTMAAHITTILIGVALGATVSIDRFTGLVLAVLRRGGRP
jgi:hypothetical protein